LTALSFNYHFKMTRSLLGVMGGKRIRTAPPLSLVAEFASGVINDPLHIAALSDGILLLAINLDKILFHKGTICSSEGNHDSPLFEPHDSGLAEIKIFVEWGRTYLKRRQLRHELKNMIGF
jgi:hypothetical protein